LKLTIHKCRSPRPNFERFGMKKGLIYSSWCLFFFYMFIAPIIGRDDPFSQYEKILNQRVETDTSVKEQAGDRREERPKIPARELGVGTCDYGLLLLLHPRMKDYNFQAQSFRAPLPSTLKVPVPYYLKAQQEKRGKFLRELGIKEEILRQNQDKLREKLRLLRMNFDQKVSEITRKGSSDGQVLADMMEEAEDRYFQKRLELEERISSLSDKHKKWKDNHSVEIYLPEAQRNEILRAISQEIQALLEKLSQRHGIDVVLNREIRVVKALPSAPRKSPDYYELAEYENAFSKFMDRPLAVGEGNAAMSTRGMYRSLAAYFSNYREIHQYFKPVLSRHLFLGETKELTFEALNTLWSSYKFPDKKISAMLEAIQNWARR